MNVIKKQNKLFSRSALQKAELIRGMESYVANNIVKMICSRTLETLQRNEIG